MMQIVKCSQNHRKSIFYINVYPVNIIFLLKNYVKPSYLKSTPIEDIQFKNPINYVKNENIYLGGKLWLILIFVYLYINC